VRRRDAQPAREPLDDFDDQRKLLGPRPDAAAEQSTNNSATCVGVMPWNTSPITASVTGTVISSESATVRSRGARMVVRPENSPSGRAAIPSFFTSGANAPAAGKTRV